MAKRDVPSGNVHYYFFDQVGTARTAVTPATANSVTVDEDADYYPYGGEIVVTGSTTATKYKFDGKERDTESNLDNFGARYYTSSLGRFMTPDWAARPTAVPYAVFGDPQSLNLYGFVRNDPVTRADADGHKLDCSGDNAQGIGCQMLADWNAEHGVGSQNTTAAAAAGTTAAAPTTAEVNAVAKPLVESAVGAAEKTGWSFLEGALGVATFIFASSQQTANEQQDTIQGHQNNAAPEPQAAAGGAGRRGGRHGNIIGGQHAELYALVDKNGRFLKWGVSQDASTRYSRSQLNGGRVIVVGSGTRDEMIALERALTESRPGPLNNEPWAGSAK